MGLFDGTALERPVLCDRCQAEIKACQCPPEVEPDIPPEKQRLKIRVDKRKRGKLITVIAGFSCRQEQLRSTLTKLKDQCGAGGTIEGEQLEIQGSQLDRATQVLRSLGYKI